MNYWNLACSTCGLNLRLSVPDEKLGATVNAICPRCDGRTRTTIGVPEDIQEFSEYRENFGDLPVDVQEAAQQIIDGVKKIRNDPKIVDAFKVIRENGFSVAMLFGILKIEEEGDEEISEPVSVDPKVDELGEVKKGVFSPSDEDDFRKYFKIQL